MRANGSMTPMAEPPSPTTSPRAICPRLDGNRETRLILYEEGRTIVVRPSSKGGTHEIDKRKK